MTSLQDRDVRIVWRWCRIYTAVAPRSARQRRRQEMFDHLWESERAGLAGRSVLAAAARGTADDLGWVAGTLFVALGRLLRNPMTYVVAALGFPLQAWIVSATEPTQVADPYEALGAIGGAVVLAVAGIMWWLQRLPS